MAETTASFLSVQTPSASLFDPRSAPAYRLLAIMLTAVAALAWAFDFAIDRYDLPIMAGLLAWLLGVGMALRRMRLRRTGTAIEGVALIVASTMTICCLSILLAVPAPPYRDALFDRIDTLLLPGFGWLEMFNALRSHGALLAAMSTLYSSLLFQPFALIVILALAGRERDIWCFLHAWFVTLVACVTIFALLPAVGTYGFHHLTPTDIPTMRLRVGWDEQAVLEAVRSGRLRSLTPSTMTGIIAFPSFHAASGTLLAWGFRRLRIIGPVFVVWNLAMIATAPLIGSHYFCDILAGIAVALFAIMVAKREMAHRVSNTVEAAYLQAALLDKVERCCGTAEGSTPAPRTRPASNTGMRDEEDHVAIVGCSGRDTLCLEPRGDAGQVDDEAAREELLA